MSLEIAEKVSTLVKTCNTALHTKQSWRRKQLKWYRIKRGQKWGYGREHIITWRDGPTKLQSTRRKSIFLPRLSDVTWYGEGKMRKKDDFRFVRACSRKLWEDVFVMLTCAVNFREMLETGLIGWMFLVGNVEICNNFVLKLIICKKIVKKFMFQVIDSDASFTASSQTY